MPTARISDNQREQILLLLAKGWEAGDIARKVGVTVRQVSAVKAHVTMHSYIDKASDSDLEMGGAKRSLASVSKLDNISQFVDTVQTNLSPVAISVGEETCTKKDIYWDPDPDYGSPNPHLMIMGESGFGKTYSIQCLVAEFAKLGIPSVIIDYGRGFDLTTIPAEFRNLANLVEILAGEYGIRINPLKIHPTDMNGPVNVAVRVSDSFSRVYRIGVQQHAVLRDIILEVFEDHGIYKADKASWKKPAPHLSDVKEKLEIIAADRLNPKAKIVLTLKSHISTFFIFDTFRSSGEELNWDSIALDKNSVYIIQLRGLEGRTQQIVTEFLLWDLYYYCVRSGPSRIHLYCVLDEAHNLSFKEDTPIDKLIREARKFGLGLIFASQQPQDFSDTAYANTASKLIFQTPDEKQKVAKKISNKCINVHGPALLADIIAQLPRGQAFFITRNYGFRVAIKSLSARVFSEALGTNRTRKTSFR